MAFPQRPPRPSPPSRSTGTVHAIGQRVFVACPENGPKYVTLTDQIGIGDHAHLADGVEVEVRAWQPHGKTGTRYCVRATADGVEGWIAAASLRRSRERVATPPPAAAGHPAAASPPAGRRVGRPG